MGVGNGVVLEKWKEKIKCPEGTLPSGRPLHDKVGDVGWMGKLAPGLGRVGG